MARLTNEVNRTTHEIAENSHAQNDASSDMAAAIEELTVSISMVASVVLAKCLNQSVLLLSYSHPFDGTNDESRQAD
jgi:methyl-accepting chemotaxis protein